MSTSDPDEMTDSTSGSGGISDWALVNQYGHLQDDDTESSGSSVEVMDEEEEEEEEDRITPVTGNSPPGNCLPGTSESSPPGPRFVLRLTSHEVAETDEEVSSVARSESDTPPLPCSASSESTTPPIPSSSETADTSSVTSLEDESVVETSSQDTDTSEAESFHTRPGLGRGISQEDIDSLRRAIDDVQNSLLHTQPVSPSPSSQQLVVQDALGGHTSAKKSNSIDKIAEEEHPVISPDDIPEPRIQDLLDRVTDREDDATLPDLSADRQVAIPDQRKDWTKRVAEWLYDLYKQLNDANNIMPWLFAVYLMLLCVIAYMIGVIAYHTASAAYQELVPTHDPCPVCPKSHSIEAAERWRQNWWDCLKRHDDIQRQLDEASKIQQELEQALQTARGREAVKLESNDNLQQELHTCKAHLAETNRAKAEIEGSCRHTVNDQIDRQNSQSKTDKADNLENKPKTDVHGDQSGGNREDQSRKSQGDQSAENKGHHSKQKSRKVNKDKHADANAREQKKIEKERQAKKERKKREPEGSHKTDGSKSNERSEGSSGNWMDNIFDLMNKTKDQIEETWTQVRNISDQLWTKHSPALEKLQNNFSRKFRHLTDKLQRKLEKKAKKWFGRGEGKTASEEDKQNESNNKEQRAGPRASTKRRPNRDDEAHQRTKSSDKTQQSQPDPDEHIISSGNCPPGLLKLGRKMKSLNANKYRNMNDEKLSDLQQESRRVLNRLSKRSDVIEDEVLRKWVGCQRDWWQRDEVGQGCIKFLQCWQVKVLGGHVKKCRRYKTEHGNILDRRCMKAPSHENAHGQHLETESDPNSPSSPPHPPTLDDVHNEDHFSNAFDHDEDDDGDGDVDATLHVVYNEDQPREASDNDYNGHVEHDDNEHDQEEEDDDEDDADDDNDEEDDDDGDDDLWYIRRAEDREYNRGKPDDWYFRSGVKIFPKTEEQYEESSPTFKDCEG